MITTVSSGPLLDFPFCTTFLTVCDVVFTEPPEVVVADVCSRHSQASFTPASSARNQALTAKKGQQNTITAALHADKANWVLRTQLV